MASLLFVGTIPPPLNGASTVNLAVLNKANQIEGDVRTILNQSELSSNSMIRRVTRLFFFIFQVTREYTYFRGRKMNLLYVSANAGLAMYLDILILFLFRKKAMRIAIHHHSYQYINKKKIVLQFLVFAAGKGAVHILLCADMQSKFIRKYKTSGIEINTLVLGNHFAIETRNQCGNTNDVKHLKQLRLGYLGVISSEKGFSDFLNMITNLKSRGALIESVVAGPLGRHGAHLIKQYKVQNAQDGRYVGEVRNREKQNFFDSIDVLIFPSRYSHEAQSLVTLEALSNGIFVLATKRGCYSSEPLPKGVIVFECEEWVQNVVEFLLEGGNIRQIKSLREKESIIQNFESLKMQETNDLSKLLIPMRI